MQVTESAAVVQLLHDLQKEAKNHLALISSVTTSHCQPNCVNKHEQWDIFGVDSACPSRGDVKTNSLSSAVAEIAKSAAVRWGKMTLWDEVHTTVSESKCPAGLTAHLTPRDKCEVQP
jgi:hypothetical protein